METTVSLRPLREPPDEIPTRASQLLVGADRPTPVPAQPSPLIGRDAELDDVCERLLREDVRLLTFTGPGGVGKTRLAVAAAEAVRERFAAGVALVDLSPLRDTELVMSTVAETLGVHERGPQPLAETVARLLHGRDLLLVLDNFEHLQGAAAEVSALLAACPRLRVLVTSREPLGLRWEHEYPLGPLQLPAADGPLTPETLAAVPAVALFVRQAEAVRPSFALTVENAEAVAEICRRLDGLPLALELAAARLRMVGVAALLARLEHRLDLLAARVPDAPTRHQTLREAINWSYDLLSPDEQAVFRRLAIFVGGFDVCAIEGVGFQVSGFRSEISSPETRNPEPETLDVVASLVEKSLVYKLEDKDETRFGMLETIREFGLEQLEAHGEAEGARRRHAEQYLAIAEASCEELRGPRQAAGLDRLAAEHDNLRAALGWAAECDPQLGLRSAATLWRFWDMRGHLSEGRQQLDRLLALPAAQAPTAARAQALDGQSVLARRQGDYDVAHALQQESITIRRDVGDRQGIARSLSGLGEVARARGDHDAARTLEAQGLAIMREVAVLIARGLTSREMAEALMVSERTADSHADHIRAKLELRSRSEIAAWAVAHGLYTPSQ